MIESESTSPVATSKLKLRPCMNMAELLDLANLLTLTGLAAAISSALLAIRGHLAFAVVALMVSGVCDLFDGFIARRLKRSAEQEVFGSRLDSIVDGCSFGFSPLVLAYAAGLNTPWELPILFMFAGCVVWRLAFFDMIGLQGSGKERYFIGLPVTYVAMFLPLAFLAGFWGQVWLRACVFVVMLALAAAMISQVPIRKPSGIFYVIFPVCGIVLAVVFIANSSRFLP
ncbi:MAG: CDP-alcohol phosphatidyltransferase family protein [Pirellulaceae bacterium]